MTGINHGITGAVIALSVKNPLLAVPAAFISHFLQDAVPHFDYFSGPKGKNLLKKKFNIFLIADFLASLVLMVILAVLFPSQKGLIWLCMVAAASPDLAWGYYLLYQQRIKKIKPKLDRLTKLHASIENEIAQGAYFEAAWFVVFTSLIVLIKSH